MNEQELEQKRKEFKEAELERKISSYSTMEAVEYRQHSLKSNYTYKRIDKSLGIIGHGLIWTHLVGLLFFSALYVLSYLPKTKFIVSKILP